MYSQDFLSPVSTYEKFINFYKQYAINHKGEKKLTESQHDVARSLGFKDWQSFDYYMKKLYNEVIPSTNLSESEWNYIFDAMNGTIFAMNYSKNNFLAELIDANSLDHMAEKWFDENTEETYQQFIQKLTSYSDLQIQGVLALVQSWWMPTWSGTMDEMIAFYADKDKPRIKCKLSDGNAFGIMGDAIRAMKKANYNKIEEYQKEAMSSDYSNLILTTLKYLEDAGIEVK